MLPDHDECAADTHKCSHHADCLNTRGSFKCKCKPGFRGNGFECSGEKKVFSREESGVRLLFFYPKPILIGSGLRLWPASPHRRTTGRGHIGVNVSVTERAFSCSQAILSEIVGWREGQCWWFFQWWDYLEPRAPLPLLIPCPATPHSPPPPPPLGRMREHFPRLLSLLVAGNTANTQHTHTAL